MLSLAEQVEADPVAGNVFPTISYAGWKVRFSRNRIRLKAPDGQRWPDLVGFDAARNFALGFWASSVPGKYPEGRPTTSTQGGPRQEAPPVGGAGEG